MTPVEDLSLGAPSGAELGVPGQDDMDLVRRTAQLHSPVTTPAGVVCRNCSWPYPCATRIACDELLETASVQGPAR
jgi:hypothetical protein